MVNSTLIKASIALLLGLLVGAEREKAMQTQKFSDYAGIRSFVLVSLFGFFSTYISTFLNYLFLISSFLVMGGLIITSYIYDSFRRKQSGITTEIAGLLTFGIGVLSYFDTEKAIILGILVAFLLAAKEFLHKKIRKISKKELMAAIKFAVVAFIILPILPNRYLDPWGVFNPYIVWLLIVLVLGISFVGYVLAKFIGTEKGIGLTGAIGGLVSSTAVATSMSNESRENKRIVLPFVFAVIIASAVMFARVFLEVFIVNKNLVFMLLAPLGAMVIASLIIIFFLWLKSKHLTVKANRIKLSSPFQLKSALYFGAFFAVILFLIEFAKRYFGENGVYATAVISGVVDTDAITLSLSNLAKSGGIAKDVAVKGITVAVVINTVIKGGIAFIFGGKKFRRYIAVLISIIAVSGIAGMALVI